MIDELFECGGVIVEGKLRVEGRRVFEQAMARFPEGAHVTVRVSVTKRIRSLRQNRYWWGTVIKLFGEYCGYEPQEMHDALCLELLPQHIHDVMTRDLKVVPGHTRYLTVSEFNDLIERTQRLGAQMPNGGVYIPDPNEVAAWS